MGALTFRPGRLGEEPEQKQLWKTAFGDTDAYIDTFYNNMYSPERMALAMDNGTLAAMCALLPVQFCLPSGAHRRGAYLYALATDPGHRGRGIARALLAWADAHLRAAGCDGICTVPAGPELHSLFAASGYQEGFTLYETVYPADTLTAARDSVITPVEAEVYGTLREAFLAGRTHVVYDLNLLAHQLALCRIHGGGFYRIEVEGGAALAAAEYTGDILMVHELLAPPLQTRAAVSILAGALPARAYRVRTPDGEGSPVAFGMMKWYDGGAAQHDGYLAFALD